MGSSQPQLDSAPDRRSREHYAILLLTLAALALFLVFGRLLDPDPRGYGTHEQLGLEGCWMAQELGVACPGCGVTTALVLASRGRLLDSLVTQPFGFLLASSVVVGALWAVVATLLGRDLWRDLQHLRFWTWARPLALALVLGWTYKAARMRGWF